MRLVSKDQRSAYQLPAAYRAFALAMSAVLMLLPVPLPVAKSTVYLILGILAVFSLVWILLPYMRNYRLGYIGLGIDVVVSTTPLFLTGGPTSPFLLYSFTPILGASLVFPRWVALGCATISSLSLVASLSFTQLSQLNFSIVVIYVIASLLIALISYNTNLSISRRVEQAAALKERKRLARELHDTVAQALAYVTLKAGLVGDNLAKGNLTKSLKELEQMKESIDSTYEAVRRTIDSLGAHPARETVDFVPALAHQVKEFSRKNGIASELSLPKDGLDLSPETANELLYIIGEAMVNARNHALATSLEVSVGSLGGEVEVAVKDNGCGFDLAAYEQSKKAHNPHGLTIMKERAESLGGRLGITSVLGRGTEVKVAVPLEQK